LVSIKRSALVLSSRADLRRTAKGQLFSQSTLIVVRSILHRNSTTSAMSIRQISLPFGRKSLHLSTSVGPSDADYGCRISIPSVWDKAFLVLHVRTWAVRRIHHTHKSVRAEIIIALNAVSLRCPLRTWRTSLTLLLLLAVSKHVEEIELSKDVWRKKT